MSGMVRTEDEQRVMEKIKRLSDEHNSANSQGGCICSDCGSVLMTKECSPPKTTLQPIDSEATYRTGKWLEVVPCKRCSRKRIIYDNI